MTSKEKDGRGYKGWTPQLDATLLKCLTEVKVNGLIENGKFKPGAYKAVEKLLNGFHPEAGIKADPHKHPECANKNRVPFPNYDELLAIFGKGRAVGSNVKQITDPAPEPSTDNVQEKNESFVRETSPDEMIREMEDNFVDDMLNTENAARFEPMINKTIEALGEMLAEETVVELRERDTLVEELKKLDGISEEQVFDATLLLLESDNKLRMFYHLDTNDSKKKYILRLLR
ncbi:hypothetical protein LINPERHAP1_LOCUS23006 [Linum perenne]